MDSGECGRVQAHTRGPWSVLPEEADRDYIRIRGTNLGHRYKIANVLTVHYEGGRPSEAEETRANARLIAAAPELLSALQRTLNWLSGYPGGGTMAPYGPYEQAREAIAKATGASA